MSHRSSQSEVALSQQGGRHPDREGTARIRLLALTGSNRNQGDVLEKKGAGRAALAELGDLSGPTHCARGYLEQRGDLDLNH